jgi:NAD(P)-dependent dehydrogenase (short-subunit alcohol dehydrogenase family)
MVSDLPTAHEDAGETVRLAREAGGQADFLPCDVTVASECARLVDETVAAYGRLDFAHNNAGVPGIGPRIVDAAEADFDRILKVNLKGVWLTMKHEILAMVRAGGGAIVNTASVAGLTGGPFAGAYVASKHAVVGLTRSAALEYADRGIRINAVCPGAVRTRMTDALEPEQLEAGLSLQAIDRIGEPEEVADAVSWLLSDAASFMTGAAVAVEGGMLACP